MKRKTVTIMVIVAAAILAAAVTVILSAKDYRISKESSYPVNGTDLYHASGEELAKLDLCGYQKAFGDVKSAKEAAGIAEKVIKEVYGHDESPYIVKLNETANAWIVHGTLPPFSLGGVASIAVDRETGTVMMLMHTK